MGASSLNSNARWVWSVTNNRDGWLSYDVDLDVY
jgi:hypothetical protein